VTLGQGGATFALHDLGPVLTQASQAAEEAGFVLVGVDAPGWLQDDRIRYRLLYDDPTKIRYYSQDRWVAAPPQLLTQRLAEAGAEGVRVRLTLLAFEQIFSRPGVAEVVLDLRVTALSEDLVPVREHLLRLRQPTSPNAAGVIDAFPHLVDRAIAEIQAWLASPGSPSTPAAKRGLVKDTKAGKGGKAKAGKTKASAPAPGAREIGAPGRSPARGSAPPSTDPPN
jgi:cholesterol transport system auxiliary component